MIPEARLPEKARIIIAITSVIIISNILSTCSNTNEHFVLDSVDWSINLHPTLLLVGEVGKLNTFPRLLHVGFRMPMGPISWMHSDQIWKAEVRQRPSSHPFWLFLPATKAPEMWVFFAAGSSVHSATSWLLRGNYGNSSNSSDFLIPLASWYLDPSY